MSSTVTYVLKFETGTEHLFEVVLDRPALMNGAGHPAWAALERSKCPHCPLAARAGAVCPAAADLAPVVQRFSALGSVAKAELRIITDHFEVRRQTDAQDALSSLMGLILATSACPILARLRPLTRVHLPFVSATDNIYRIAAMHMLDAFLHGKAGDLAGLKKFLDDLEKLNQAFGTRLRLAVKNDASINAVVLLHTRAMLASLSLDEELTQIRSWFDRPAAKSAPS